VRSFKPGVPLSVAPPAETVTIPVPKASKSIAWPAEKPRDVPTVTVIDELLSNVTIFPRSEDNKE
jgi:hypothetical protein